VRKQYAAEIMFESTNIPGLYLACQAIFVLAASRASNPIGKPSPTGMGTKNKDGVISVPSMTERYAVALVRTFQSQGELSHISSSSCSEAEK
jgi:actin-related protein